MILRRVKKAVQEKCVGVVRQRPAGEGVSVDQLPDRAQTLEIKRMRD